MSSVNPFKINILHQIVFRTMQYFEDVDSKVSMYFHAAMPGISDELYDIVDW